MERILLRGARVLDPASGFDQAADVLIAGGKVQQLSLIHIWMASMLSREQ